MTRNEAVQVLLSTQILGGKFVGYLEAIIGAGLEIDYSSDHPASSSDIIYNCGVYTEPFSIHIFLKIKLVSQVIPYFLCVF